MKELEELQCVPYVQKYTVKIVLSDRWLINKNVQTAENH